MQPNKTHFPSLFIFIILVIGALFLLAVSGLLAISALVGILMGQGGASELIGAFAFGVEFLLLAACAWFVFEKVRGLDEAEKPFRIPFAEWQIVAGVAIVLVGGLIGGAVTLAGGAGIALIVMPVLTIPVVIAPIWLLFGLSTKNMEAGSRWRFFSILGLSLTAAPTSMVIIELILGAVIVVAGAFIVTTLRPGITLELAAIAETLSAQPDNMDLILELLLPYLTNPSVIAVSLLFIAVLVPIIEEMLKPLAVWLFASKLESPAQGFLFGTLSGAAFALFESLNASTDASGTWAVIVIARIGTGILHITTSGLVGLGIGYAFKEKRFGLLAACYGAAVFAHSLWNASAIGITFAGLGQMAGKAEWLVLIPVLFCVMAGLVVAFLAALIVLNRRLRGASPPQQEEAQGENPQALAADEAQGVEIQTEKE